MTEAINQARDGIETAILLAMHCRDRGKLMTKISGDLGNPKWKTLTTGMETFCPRKPEFPRSFIALEGEQFERLYSASIDDLVVDPSKAIGGGLETGMLCEDGSFKWNKLAPMLTPRGLVAITNQPHDWFCFHHRLMKEGQAEKYVMRPFAMTRSGQLCRLKVLGWRGFDADKDFSEMSEQVALSLSILEDSARSNAFRATVQEYVKMTFPIGLESYKAFFIMRDGYSNTPSGRKNPILHWVAEHFRQRSVSPIEKHLRGAEDFVVGPMRLSIAPTDGYAPMMRNAD